MQKKGHLYAERRSRTTEFNAGIQKVEKVSGFLFLTIMSQCPGGRVRLGGKGTRERTMS